MTETQRRGYKESQVNLMYNLHLHTFFSRFVLFITLQFTYEILIPICLALSK
jgi:hypothetical protein